MRESASAIVQKGASPSHVATRQNVWQEMPGVNQNGAVRARRWILPLGASEHGGHQHNCSTTAAALRNHH
jgi:hypothetical protein